MNSIEANRGTKNSIEQGARDLLSLHYSIVPVFVSHLLYSLARTCDSGLDG